MSTSMQASGFAGNTSRKGRGQGVRGPVELASERVGRDLTSVTGARSAPGSTMRMSPGWAVGVWSRRDEEYPDDPSFLADGDW